MRGQTLPVVSSLLAAALAFMVGGSAPSAADPPETAGDAGSPGGDRSAARAALADGNRRLKDGDVAGAIEDYRRAQALHPPAAAKIEFNIAKAEQARGDEPAAAAAFERFLAEALEIPPEFREEARGELHRLSAALGALELGERRPGLLVVIDGQARGKTPVEGGIWVRPGRHVITLEQDDREMFRDSIDVEGGAKVRITVTIAAPKADIAHDAHPPRVPVAIPPPVSSTASFSSSTAPQSPGVDAQADHPLWKRWWFWATVGAIAATGTTVWLLNSRSDCPSHTVCIAVSPPTYQP